LIYAENIVNIWDYTQRIRSQSVKPHGRRARPAEPRRNFGCGFYGGTGTNFEACKLNFGTAQVVMRKGVCKGTKTSCCHHIVCLLAFLWQITTFSWVYTVPNSWKALKMPHFSKTGSRNMAETCTIDFSCLTSYSTSIQLGGLSALFLPVLMGAGHGFYNSNFAKKPTVSGCLALDKG